VSRKTTAQDLKDNHVQEVLVAFEQGMRETEKVTTEITLANGTKLVPVETLEAAYKRLALFPRMTRLANERIAAEAKRFLADNCGRYVLSPLARPRTKKEQATHGASDSFDRVATTTDNHVPLTRSQSRKLVLARIASKRVRLLADSGMGKTMFLGYCEGEIAARQDGRLPIRLPHLNDLEWSSFESLVNGLASQAVLGRHLPAEYRPHIRPWVEWLLTNGYAVFLLDALDQTSLSKVRSMRHPLQAVPACHVYLTTL
jgi:hypothetical protein